MNVRIGLGHQDKQTIKTRDLIMARLRLFSRDESGVMIIMTLMFLVLMMIMGGMAVDFMRFESRRVMLQSVSDRAVLAAAEIEQDKTPADVVIDYFDKAGFGGTIIGAPDVIDTADFNSVGVTARLEMDSIYLQLLGIDKLSAPAAATAVEGVANIEVSLIVDISGSMRDIVVPEEPGETSTATKIESLRDAATTFAETMLIPKFQDKISLSFVPYSEHVNIGPDLMANLPVTKIHDWSYCVEFEEADYLSTAFDMSATYDQMQHFQWNSAYDNGYQNEVVNTICPQYDYEQIVPLTQNLASLKLEIAKLQPRAGTAIYMGLKWGLALLDPSMRTPVIGIADPAFAGRPVNFPLPGAATDTQKVIVLMTDGVNSNSTRLIDEVYNTPSHYAHWAANNFWYYYSREGGYRNVQDWDYTKFTNVEANTFMKQLCDAAKLKGVIIYSVAVVAAGDDVSDMADCASSDSHFFKATGDELESIFVSIAKQITELRLSL
jgi:Flp pilus assembly protein TadG